MQKHRILIIGHPTSPIYELGEVISEVHKMEFFTIESDPIVEEENEDYYADKIPAVYFDVGDYSAGSASQQSSRDPSAWAKSKTLDRFELKGTAEMLSEEEKQQIGNVESGVVASDVPDLWLAEEWATCVIFLKIDEDEAVDWLSQRRKCPCCGAAFHLKDLPPAPGGYCVRCGTHIVQQAKDLPEMIKKQFKFWHHEFFRIELKLKNETNGKYLNVNVPSFKNFDDMFLQIDRKLRKLINMNKGLTWGYDKEDF